jgi:hypothetical protein
VSKTRVEVGMRLVVDTESYRNLGGVMDAIEETVRKELADAGVTHAAFDFTSFNTMPCKAIQMSQFVGDSPVDPEVVDYPDHRDRPALPHVGYAP